MDEQKKDEAPVEDIELKAEEAEDVKGGFSWGVNQTFKPTESVEPIPGNQRGGWDGNHNETLVVI